MNTSNAINFTKNFALIILLILGSNAWAGQNNESNKNDLSIQLENATVNVKYISVHDPNNSEMLTLKNIQAAEFNFSKNMNVNGTHIESGKYEVSLIEFKDGLGFNFHALDSKTEDQQIALDKSKGTYSEYINYSLQIVEDDKIAGLFQWKNSNYAFSMEVSLSNTIYSYVEKEERENTIEWIDYYQAAIYAYKNNINLEESYELAQKAMKYEMNEYTTELNQWYLNALNEDNAQQLSALQE